MKTRHTKYISLIAITPLLGAILCLNQNKVNGVEAYDKSSLPTEINLNDYSDNDIRSYYSNLNSLDNSERTGTNLLKNLKPILSHEQKYYSYDVSSGKDIWKMYEITDRDWSKSPASAIDGYNAATNSISGYKYGDSKTNKGSNPYIHALYVNRSENNKVHAWATEEDNSSHGNNAMWCIDREHIWPKSQGFEDSSEDPGTSGARGDPMHLWAGDSYVNSALHSNYFYGYVDKTKPYTDGKDKYTYASGNLMGLSKTKGGSVSVFEPQDSDKGDIARAVFYMVARYNNIAGNDSTIENDNPNLELVSDLAEWHDTGYISTSTTTGKLGIVEDLLAWNKLDPVDEYELHRNNLLYGNFTNNRNPFIDFPEWADLIWGAHKNVKFAAPNVDEIARPQDFVPPAEDVVPPAEDTTPEKGDGNIIPGVPNVVLYIAASVVAAIIIIVVVVILLKGNKKQKKSLKKVAKKVVKSSSKKKK
ncbi:MAG: endonuclease [Bacilli bacterium]|nr:endonuclease [Bacilli bacterium]